MFTALSYIYLSAWQSHVGIWYLLILGMALAGRGDFKLLLTSSISNTKCLLDQGKTFVRDRMLNGILKESIENVVSVNVENSNRWTNTTVCAGDVCA